MNLLEKIVVSPVQPNRNSVAWADTSGGTPVLKIFYNGLWYPINLSNAIALGESNIKREGEKATITTKAGTYYTATLEEPSVVVVDLDALPNASETFNLRIPENVTDIRFADEVRIVEAPKFYDSNYTK